MFMIKVITLVFFKYVSQMDPTLSFHFLIAVKLHMHPVQFDPQLRPHLDLREESVPLNLSSLAESTTSLNIQITSIFPTHY